MSTDKTGWIARGVHRLGQVINTIFSWNFGEHGPPGRNHRYVCCICGASCGVYCSYLILLSPMVAWTTAQSTWPSLVYFLELVFSHSPIILVLIFFVIVPGSLSIALGVLFGWLVAFTSPQGSTALTLFIQSLILVIVLLLFLLLVILTTVGIFLALFAARGLTATVMRRI